MTMQLALYGLGAVFIIAGAVMVYRDWRKKHPKAVKLAPSAVTDDIPDLIAAARLAQSVGCQKGVDAMLGVVADRLAVVEKMTWKVQTKDVTTETQP